VETEESAGLSGESPALRLNAGTAQVAVSTWGFAAERAAAEPRGTLVFGCTRGSI